ncbi:TniB family NTP-binding protein (plasmid) [Cereibacter azotoformans]|uniref:AAA+ ATPase domain-containing protein n=1 Tax=Cereibacter sphaeroides (strain ATCC 17025 / ATH 2.4.3) TaxID=349102 RepID=A4X0C1_CERS5|nr:TniB family NTP-binding protein [Cereibacter azotoformans]AXQ96161.1 AAA family ATPase [Cereibacter sphaeroides]UIJ33001.1 TniB family NTP-binding protein [Cereibacter azotoformans]ULB12261.1 TniB family NTP-binding protein [Cereibacter azotoformans]
MTEFPHLYPGAGRIAALSAEERILRIRADRWISYPRAEAALAKLETLMSFPERARMPNLLLVGESGMGKTMIIEKFTRDHAASFDDTTGRLNMPVVAVQMAPGPDETRFYRRILAAIGAPEPPRATLAVLESLALRLLTELRPHMLVIDEIHSLQAGTIREQARFLNMLRFLGNELRVPLVCVGTAQARNALRTDAQLVRRFEAFALPPWQEGTDFTGLMSTLIRSLPLRRESEIDDKALARMLKMTGGITSGVFSIMSQLAIAAIESGEERVLTRDVLGGDRLQAALGEPV